MPADGEAMSRVRLARFGRPHGVAGEVRLQSFTADPLAVASYGPLTTQDGARSFTIAAVRPAGEVLIARVAGITGRAAAEALNGLDLYVERARLPEPEDADEFLLADLIGCAVHDEAGQVLGRIVDVPNFGAGDLIEIRLTRGGPTVLLPFTRAFVPGVEIAARKVVIAPPADFLDAPEPPPSARSRAG